MSLLCTNLSAWTLSCEMTRTASPLAITALSTQAQASASHAAVGSSKRRSTFGFPCAALKNNNTENN